MPLCPDDEMGCGGSDISKETLPAIQLAQQHLRRQPAPLGNYELELHPVNSQCDVDEGLKAFFDAIHHGPKYLIIFGGVCPSVASIIAESLKGWNLVQLSFALPAAMFEDERRYPHFFSVVPSENALHSALIKLLKYYSWNRVGILRQDGQEFSEVQQNLTKMLLSAKVHIASMESFISDPSHSLRTFKENDVRIIIGLFNESLAAEVFCCAYHLNMFSSGHQWVMPRWNQKSWRMNRNSGNCSYSSLQKAMDGSISVDFETVGSKQTRGISGQTPQEYEQEYELLRNQQGVGSGQYHGFAYDGVWVLTKALARVMETVRDNEKYSELRNYTVSDEEMSQMVAEAMSETSFWGVTGHVMFRNGKRMGVSIRLTQLQDGNEIEVGEYNSTEDRLVLKKNLRFKGLSPPRDRTVVLHQRGRVNTGVYSVMSLVTILAMCMASSLLFFNMKHRHHWAIWMSSPFINNLIIVGGMLSYSFIILFGLDGFMISDGSFGFLCTVRTWTLALGHTMGFGAMFAKTWRVHAIYKNMQLKKKVIKDLRLIVMIGSLLLIDLFVLICWHIVDPQRRAVEEYRTEVDLNGNRVVLHTSLEHCESMYMNTWLTIVYVYKGILMVFCCVLSWETRHVSVPAPNDSKYIGWSLYSVVVLCLICTAGSALTRELPNIQFCLVSLSIFTATTVTLTLVFIPKLILLKGLPGPTARLPQLKIRQFIKKQHQTSKTSKTGRAHTDDLEDLQDCNQQLRNRIIELDEELDGICMQLENAPPLNLQESHPESLVITHAEVSGKNCSVSEASQKEDHKTDVNSPECIQRRLSVQLPILHHAYLLSIGGVNASPSMSLELDS
ncbi:gamma-aminobutyric acid type B receptor subunit 2-like [Engraulis encrasicolus]|uniref:gamma-aminobutyric acid type B receptor subunit 2-like n=1 Tax=Engraulis encrasicolus TaxID=184585 RepID=UPI002FD346E9